MKVKLTNDNVLIEKAKQYLDELFKQNQHELDLPCSYFELTHHWIIEKNDNYQYIINNQLYYHHNMVAEYRIIFDNQYHIVDEFFITNP